tara:strand:+ start:23566 stop:24063 length:498 start_codon:yes stop_codon:yes gene_type:complete
MTQPIDENTELAVARATGGRRILGLVSLALLGVLLIYVAFVRPPAAGWQLFLIVVGGGTIWMADKMRRATAGGIVLTETELRDTDGTLIARIDDIESMDRGFFAFKPSNGFLLKTTTPGSRVWRPGMWWRMGRRIGVGGMTPGRHTKPMSEIIAIKLAQRDFKDI